VTESSTIQTGYSLESVVFPVQRLATVQAQSVTEEHEVGWGWDWRWIDSEHFEVALMLHVAPSQGRMEELEVAAAALFRLHGDAQTVEVEKFAHSNAPALLFPYIRQVVDALTSRGPFGRVLMSPTNMVALMERFPLEDATGHTQSRPASTDVA
jgi:preprotein translocase subunit SecB